MKEGELVVVVVFGVDERVLLELGPDIDVRGDLV